MSTLRKRWPFILLIAVFAVAMVAIRLGRASEKTLPQPLLTATPSTSAAAHADSKTVAEEWLLLYLAGRTAPSQDAWLVTLGDSTTDGFYRLLQGTDRMNLPAGDVTSVTGYETPSTSIVTARLSTGAALVVTLERATMQAQWLIADVRPGGTA